MKAKIRHAALADIPQMLELWRHFWPPQSYEQNLSVKINTDPDLVLVAGKDGRLVGTVIGGYDLWWAWVYRLAVHPDYQRCGIAKQLLSEIHKRLLARGADSACLFASPQNEPMAYLLESLGYKRRDDVRYSLGIGKRPEKPVVCK